jgi:hypothetical protein
MHSFSERRIAMTDRSFTGKYVHKSSNEVLQYVCHYHFTALGVVYEAHAGFGDGKTTRLVHGVIAWGLRAIPPKAKVERAVRETIDIIDIAKFRRAVADISP